MNVKEVDYQGLVEEMALAGTDGDKMAEVLFRKRRELDKPKTENELVHFWAALFNAAKKSKEIMVWLWLCAQPEIRAIAPPETEYNAVPWLVEDIPLPVIGGPDDEPLPSIEGLKQYSAEPTENNFKEQAAALDAFLRKEGKKSPSNPHKSVQDFVASFYNSGNSRQMMAQMILAEMGFRTLATPEGIEYLRENYPPSPK